ncbi:hypothetical protein OG21DRAFT_1491035 [Imleria badia]|nr:hypothetical protein OG21DRAFT_1491035 [Imleria badia]
MEEARAWKFKFSLSIGHLKSRHTTTVPGRVHIRCNPISVTHALPSSDPSTSHAPSDPATHLRTLECKRRSSLVLRITRSTACLASHDPKSLYQPRYNVIRGLVPEGLGRFYMAKKQGQTVLIAQELAVENHPDLWCLVQVETLADEFWQLALLLQKALNFPGADQHERLSHLNLEMQRVVTNIREPPGLSRFLPPPLFSDHQLAASARTVIIVNASQYSCDALVVLLDWDPVHIPLQTTRRESLRDLSTKLNVMVARKDGLPDKNASVILTQTLGSDRFAYC